MTAGLKERMRLRHSLALAQEVQQNLLPSAIPRFEGLDIASHSSFCDETGGDYFDFLQPVPRSGNIVGFAFAFE